MGKWGCAILMAVVACSGGSAAWADDTRSIGFTDPCGDNHAGYEYDGAGQELPGTANRDGFDVRSFNLSQTETGLRATFEMCGDIGPGSGLGGFRAASSGDDHCWITIGTEEGLVPGLDRKGRFIKT